MHCVGLLPVGFFNRAKYARRLDLRNALCGLAACEAYDLLDLLSEAPNVKAQDGLTPQNTDRPT